MAMPQRAIPPGTLRSLFPPPALGQYTYFEGSNRFPFESTARTHSPQNAWWLAEYALLAYENLAAYHQQPHALAAFLHPSQPPLLLEAFTWLESPPTTTPLGVNTQGYVLETPEYAVLAFRGTEFPWPGTVDLLELQHVLADILQTDLRAVPQPINVGTPAFRTAVHPGFVQALQSVWDQLHEPLQHLGTKPLWVTGHSMGGAITTLLASRMPTKIAGVYTFGSPCAGTRDFANAYNATALQHTTFRYVHGGDAVASLLTLLRYQHVGQLVQLDAGTRRGPLIEGLRTVGLIEKSFNLIDHAPIFYTYETWNALP